MSPENLQDGCRMDHNKVRRHLCLWYKGCGIISYRTWVIDNAKNCKGGSKMSGVWKNSGVDHPLWFGAGRVSCSSPRNRNFGQHLGKYLEVLRSEFVSGGQ